jgi:hypothetical protein
MRNYKIIILILLSYICVTAVNAAVPYDLKELETEYKGLDYNKKLRKYSSFTDEGFTATKFGYFLVFSNLPESQTYNLIDNDIRNTSNYILKNFAVKTPPDVINVFLFENRESYDNALSHIFRESSLGFTTSGFYHPQSNSVLALYTKRESTVSHEIIHSITASDFQDIPAWFDEGFATLFQDMYSAGSSRTFIYNTDLEYLQNSIRSGTYVQIDEMMRSGENGFYENIGFNYPQAEFILRYLNDKDLLKKYYKFFRSTVQQDSTGIKQLERVTGITINELDKEFRNYILSLRSI